MRGLSRLRAPASALSSSTCSLRTPLSSPAAAFSSASSQYTTQHISATRARVWQNTLQTSPRRCLSTATPRCDKQTTDLSTPEASTDLLEDEFFDDELVEGSEFDTDLVYPRAAVEVPTAQEITDPDYVPAESGDGLEEVGGLVDWWERPGHWGESKKYVGFGPVEKVGDPAVLEVLARRAVIEALAIKQYSKKSAKDKTAAALQAVIGQEELSSIEEVELAPGENNTVAVKDQDDLKIVWSSLSKAAPASAPSSPSISIHEARRLSRTWGNEWKAAVIQDPIVKFYVRLYPTPDPLDPSHRKELTLPTTGRQTPPETHRPRPHRHEAPQLHHHWWYHRRHDQEAQAQEAGRAGRAGRNNAGAAQRPVLPQESDAHRQGADGRSLEAHPEGAAGSRAACYGHWEVHQDG